MICMLIREQASIKVISHQGPRKAGKFVVFWVTNFQAETLRHEKTFRSSVRPIIIFSFPQTDESWRFLVLVVLRQACLFTLLPCSLLAAFKQAASDSAEQRQQPIIRFIYSFMFLDSCMFHKLYLPCSVSKETLCFFFNLRCII